jgi:EAL domain-containing protein (putative c-di-GMP-specific phosphodiesterase class I)
MGEQLWTALCAGQVGVALQPVVALGTLPRLDRVVALEALARWTRPDGVSVPPARFVAAARRSGLADVLGATVLAQGLAALRRRRAAGEPELALSVNVAPEQLSGPSFGDAVGQALEGAGIDPRGLSVEVPAGAGFHDDRAALAALEALRAIGVGVVLDDFGATGLSIAALRDLPLTGVKLDRSLTADLGADDRLVVATVRLTTRLGLTCTAVGVETQAQLDAARALGIDAVQGHLVGRPEPVTSPPVEHVPAGSTVVGASPTGGVRADRSTYS